MASKFFQQRRRQFQPALKERFGFRVLSAFIVVIVFVLAAFTLFAAVREGARTKNGLREQGQMLAELLSESVTLGLYAENRPMLTHAVKGFLHRSDVVTLSIYDAHLNLLYEGDKSSVKGAYRTAREAAPELGTLKTLRIAETRDAFEFTMPVLFQSSSARDESIYFGNAAPPAPDRLIGYVRIVLSKDAYRRQIAGVIVQQAAILLIFIAASVGIIYVAVRKITRPLENLTEKVIALGKGLPVEPALVETRDEIGNLASAFNEMVLARRLAEESLRASEQRFRLIAETITEVFWISDTEINRKVYVSPGYIRVWGRPSGTLHENPGSFYDAVHPEDRNRVLSDIAALKRGASFDHEYRIIRPDGVVRLIWDRGYPVRDETGRVACYVGVAQDVTERRGMEDKILNYQRELRAAVLELSSIEARTEERERHFIAADLHDYVGQNLVVSNFKLGALKKALSSPEAASVLDEIRELIGKTIQYTRSLTVELSPPVLVEIGFKAAIQSLAQGFQKNHGISIRIRDDGMSDLTADNIRHVLFRSVRELLMNVVKHAQASRAWITINRDEDAVWITVSDNGTGFDSDAIAENNNGFGLFSIRERMKRLGGYCEIKSKPGNGTEVVLAAPLKNLSHHRNKAVEP